MNFSAIPLSARVPQRQFFVENMRFESDDERLEPLKQLGDLFRNPRIFIVPQALRQTRRVHPNLIDARPRRDIESLPVGIAEFDVGGELGRENRAQMLALR